MNKTLIFFLAIFILSLPTVAYSETYLPDEPEPGRDESIGNVAIDSYTQALDIWKTAEDINQWVAGSFTYDRPRAITLSSNRKSGNKEISIYTPSEFFTARTGVCVDLARFGVETLKKIAPDSDPKYLMIEFQPVQINGNIFRLHWLVSFKKDGKNYFFCDSKRPGFMAGPYESTQVFINGYEKFRGRHIVAYRELESYKKKKKLKSKKQKGLYKNE
jgi:Transglutaminase-like domain